MDNGNVINQKGVKVNKCQRQQIFSWLCGLFLGMVFSVDSLAADIQVSVDRNPVSLNESFRIIFSATESPDDDPDFRPLDKTFQVLNQQKNSQSSWVNGQSTTLITWTLDVMAKKAGSLTIPRIAFGDDASAELQINVLAAAANTKMGVDDELYLQVNVSPDQPYVQSQLLYTIRLFQRVQISQASLSEPAPVNAIVEKIGEDSQYQTNVNGVNYSVFERQYAIFPQQSGLLEIPPVTLTAQVVTGSPSSRYGSLFSTQRTQTRRVQSKAIQLDVLPAVDDFIGDHWLAAESVQLQQTWSVKDLTVAVGEPITRTITLLAKGVSASQLPELEQKIPSSAIKVYPDQPTLKNQLASSGVTGMREQKLAIIPSESGDYRLPAIEVPWFNTKTQTIERAFLPAAVITVVAQAAVERPKVMTDIKEKPATDVIGIEQKIPVDAVGGYWKGLSIFLGFGWLLTIAYLLIKKPVERPAKETTDNNRDSIKAALKSLQTACKNNEAKQAKKALIHWGYLLHHTKEIDHISLYCDASLKTEIQQLNKALYAKEKTNWDGASLAVLAQQHTHQWQEKDQQKTDDELETLHPLS